MQLYYFTHGYASVILHLNERRFLVQMDSSSDDDMSEPLQNQERGGDG